MSRLSHIADVTIQVDPVAAANGRISSGGSVWVPPGGLLHIVEIAQSNGEGRGRTDQEGYVAPAVTDGSVLPIAFPVDPDRTAVNGVTASRYLADFIVQRAPAWGFVRLWSVATGDTSLAEFKGSDWTDGEYATQRDRILGSPITAIRDEESYVLLYTQGENDALANETTDFVAGAQEWIDQAIADIPGTCIGIGITKIPPTNPSPALTINWQWIRDSYEALKDVLDAGDYPPVVVVPMIDADQTVGDLVHYHAAGQYRRGEQLFRAFIDAGVFAAPFPVEATADPFPFPAVSPTAGFPTTDLLRRYEADLGVSSRTANVADGWLDCVAQNHRLAAVGSFARPITGTQTLNSLNVLSFDGTARILGNYNWGVSAGYAMAMLIHTPSSLSTYTLFDAYSSTPTSGRTTMSVVSTGVLQALFGGTLRSTGAGVITADAAHLLLVEIPASGDGRLYVNNLTSALLTNINGNSPFDNVLLGGTFAGGNPWPTGAQMVGMWIWSGDTLSAQNKSDLVTYIHGKWGNLGFVGA